MIDQRIGKENSGLTNWMPVSLRIPIPAEAKLAPTSSLFPVSCGLKYGNVGSEPRASPDIISTQIKSIQKALNIGNKIKT